MKITKIGHSCIVFEIDGQKILFDPGAFTSAQNEVMGLNMVIITQEHGDHLAVESLKIILKNNSRATIITNSGVGKILKENNIEFKILEHGQSAEINGISIEAFGKEHAYIYSNVPEVMNTGYLIAEKFFHPGDALTKLKITPKVLALPIAGPWIKISEAIDYGKAVGAKFCFPIHDGVLSEQGKTVFYRVIEKSLEPAGIKFTALKDGEAMEI